MAVFWEFPSSSLGGTTTERLGPKIYLKDKRSSLKSYVLCEHMPWVSCELEYRKVLPCGVMKFVCKESGFFVCFVSCCDCVLAAEKVISPNQGCMEDTKCIFFLLTVFLILSFL